MYSDTSASECDTGTNSNNIHRFPNIDCEIYRQILRMFANLLRMLKLNLPEFDVRIRKENDKFWIFDSIRKKEVVLTPEEWVRQHFINYLIHHLGYPKSLIRIEGGLKYNQLSKRADIVVFDRNGNPWMVIECKSSDQAITESTAMQASVYNHTFKAKYLAVTNGLKHYCAQIDWKTNGCQLLTAMPEFEI
jgi:hypothetical protein